MVDTMVDECRWVWAMVKLRLDCHCEQSMALRRVGLLELGGHCEESKALRSGCDGQKFGENKMRKRF